MRDLLRVVLVEPRFPENIGMAARACANMGVSDLVLVRPERFDLARALPLATAQGASLLETARLADSLAEALSGLTMAVGATARTGGWRKNPLSPEKAAREIGEAVGDGGRAALVFGPEDCGLSNEHIDLCTRLVTIPTARGGSSLNLAQAVLLLLYECFKVCGEADSSRHNPRRGKSGAGSRTATLAEEALLFNSLQAGLQRLDVIPRENAAWFMQPLRRYLRRSGLRRHEFDFLMGVCRQIGLKCPSETDQN